MIKNRIWIIMKMKQWIYRICPKYGLFPMLLALGYNCFGYWISGVLTKNRNLNSLAIGMDDKIPLIEWTIIIYLGCYLFWGVNYLFIYRQSKEKAYQFLVADLLSRTVCFGLYLLYPTTIERPEVLGEGICATLVRLLYQVDVPVNLFPSIHCLVSWNCWVGIRTQKGIPCWYKYASLLMAVAVCLSTVTTRQHVIVDIVGGVILSEVTCWIGQKTEWWRYVEKVFNEIAYRVFGRSQRRKEGITVDWIL